MMANAFDQFDETLGYGAVDSGARPPDRSGNPFDQFDDARGYEKAPPRSSLGSMTVQGTQGFNSAVAGVLGAPVDAVSWLASHGPSSLIGNQPESVKIDKPVGGSEWIKDKMADVGIMSGQVAPQTTGERYARAAGAGIGAAVMPEFALGALGKAGAMAPGAVSSAGKMIGASETGGQLAGNAVIGATSGLGAQGGEDVLPEPYKPLGALVGGLTGGLAGAGVTAIPGGIAAAGRTVAETARPFSAAGQEAMAADRLASAATNPAAARVALETAHPAYPSGFKPTTAQAADDMGLLQFERALSDQPGAKEAILARRGEQSASLTNALGDIQAEGHPEAVADFFRKRMADLDRITQEAEDAARSTAQTKFGALGRGQAPEVYGQALHDELSPRLGADMAAAQQATAGLAAATPESAGSTLRAAQEANIAAMKARTSALFKAVDPDNSLYVTADPLKGTVGDIYGKMSAEQKLTVSPVEQQLASLISDYGPTLPFSRLNDLRSVVSNAMADARSGPAPNLPAYGRLTQLREAVSNAIADTIGAKAIDEQRAMATGALRPEDAMLTKLQQQTQDWYEQRAADTAMGQRAGQGARADAGARQGRVPSMVGTKGSSGNGPRNPSGDQGLPPASGTPVDEAAKERLDAALASHRELAQTRKAADPLLRRPGATYPYDMPDAAVAQNVWRPGPTGGEIIKQRLKAAGNTPEAIEAVRDMAAASLRAKAMNDIVTPKLFGQWRAAHAPAIEQLESAAPGSVARFSAATKAAEALERFGSYSPDIPPSVLPERYLGTGDQGFANVQDLRSLIGKEKADDLLNGYAADAAKRAAGKEDGTFDSKKLDAWRAKHSGALRALPELDNALSDAGKAASYVARVAESRRNAIETVQKGSLGKLLDLQQPGDVVREIGSVFGRRDATQRMREIAAAAQKDPQAWEGLRKAIADHMMATLGSTTEAGLTGVKQLKAAQFKTFLAKNETVLSSVFTPEEIAGMRSISNALDMQARSINATKLPGDSGTNARLRASDHYFPHDSILSRLVEAARPGAIGAAGGILVSPLAGVVSFLGKRAFDNMRARGLERVDELVRDAMLDPDIAKALLAKAPKAPDTGSARTLARALAKGVLVGSGVGQGQ